MGLISRVFFGKEQGGTKILTSADLADLLSGGQTSSGVSVSIQAAMKFATVWACVRLLTESIAQLPCHVYVKEKDGSKSRVTDIGLSEQLSGSPNHWQTNYEYTEFMVTALLMRGNHVAFVSKDSKGEVLEQIPFNPASVELKREGLNNVRYIVQTPNGQDTYYPDQVTHVRGLTFDGFWGVSPITYHRETIGLAMAAQRYGATIFKNGGRPSGVLKVVQELSEGAYERLRKYWNNMGSEDVGKTAILEEGMDYATVSMSNADAQYLEVRQFQRSDICSIFRVPPHMDGDLTKASFSNITQQSLEFVKYSILPICKRLEAAMYRDLLTYKQRQRGMYVEYLVDGLERADIETRYKTYRYAINSGIMSPNEARAKENMNPRPNGDIYPMQINLTDSATGLPSAKSKVLKTKQVKGVIAREKIRKQYKGRFAKVAALVVRSETAQVRKIFTQKAAPSIAEIVEGLEELYATFPGRIESAFRALVREYSVAVRNAALKETDSDSEIDIDQLSDFTDDVLNNLVLSHTGSSLNQLKSIIEKTDPEEVIEALQQRLNEWEERRPAKIAERETIRQESAISRFVWLAAGVTLLQWVTRGSKSCPFCNDLGGKIVGINAPFVERGNYEPPGHEGSPWKVRGPKMHPQIHEGCQCVIVPTTE